MINTIDLKNYFPYMTHRYEVTVDDTKSDKSVYPAGYSQSWSVTGVTETCLPEAPVYISGSYGGSTSVITGKDSITIHFETKPSTTLTMLVLWRETVLYEG